MPSDAAMPILNGRASKLNEAIGNFKPPAFYRASLYSKSTNLASRWVCPGKSSGSFYNWSSSSNYGSGYH
ncbi:hypothetical protein Taro_039243 [Colocasia esculenta]|uniref:Uncharacterized protein n=1 Tax=Colocasia esculenta TaxID=4460 RepID=A0A843WI98_COLES|nr:hypothetical protein [Colocasia esculenta]